jgi:hypothetical protein
MKRHLGTFELPSGAEMVAYLDGNRVDCEWSRPLSRRDRRYYLRHVGPIIIKRAVAALGIDGAGLWVLM